MSFFKKGNKTAIVAGLLLMASLVLCKKIEDQLKFLTPPDTLEDNPEILRSVPAPGQTGVQKDQPIILEFNKKIDEQKCIASFNIQPPLTGIFKKEGVVMTFTSSTRFVGGTTYIFTMSQDCEDTEGRDLKEAYSSSFAVGAEISPPSVVAVRGRRNVTGCLATDPFETIADFQTDVYNSTDFCEATPVEIRFSEPMDRSSVEGNFNVAPSMIGAFQWSESDSVMRFVPKDNLQNGVTYVFTLGRGGRDKAENNLVDAIAFSLTVGAESEKPQIVIQDGYIQGNAGGTGPDCTVANAMLASIANPVTGLRNLNGVCTDSIQGLGNRNTPILVYFSEDMDISTADAAFDIRPAINGIKSWSNDATGRCGLTQGNCGGGSSLLTFTPIASWTPSTTYTVTLGGAAEDISGNTLSQNHSFSFTVGVDNTPPTMDFASALCADALCGVPAASCAAGTIGGIAAFQSDICHQARNGITGQQLSFVFIEPMERNLTASAFTIVPDVTGVVSWPAANQMTFEPTEDLQLNTQYEVTISTVARDLAGNAMTSQFIRKFTTGNGSGDLNPPSGQSVSTDRTGGTGGCDAGVDDDVSTGPFHTDICTARVGGPGAVIRVVFNEAMDQAKTAAAFSISPVASGVISWNGAGTELTFTTTGALEPSRLHTVTVGTQARDAAGNKLASNFSLAFQTTALGGNPTVVQIEVNTLAGGTCTGPDLNILTANIQNACENTIIRATFSESMDQALTENAFSVSPSAAGVFTWNGAGTQMTFTPDQNLTFGKRYDIRVSKSALDVQGHALTQDVNRDYVVGALDNAAPDVNTVDFQTETTGVCNPLLGRVINSATPDVCVATPIVVHFSETMDADSFGAVNISPFAGVSYVWNANFDQLTITPQGSGFKSDTIYSLTVDTTAKDPAGNTLSTQFALSFTTENTSPRVTAVGLQSHGGLCDAFGDPGATVASLPRDSSAGLCWWDDSKAIGAATNYRFVAGGSGLNAAGGNGAHVGAGCNTDVTTDNFRIIFSRYMSITTQSAVDIKRISTPQKFPKIVNFSWSDCRAVSPFGCRVLTFSVAEAEDRSCGTATEFGGGDFNMSRDDNDSAQTGTPYYQITVDQTAEDTDGGKLPSAFSFFMEGN